MHEYGLNNINIINFNKNYLGMLSYIQITSEDIIKHFKIEIRA